MYRVRLHLEAAGSLEFTSQPLDDDQQAQTIEWLEANYPTLQGHFTLIPEPPQQ